MSIGATDRIEMNQRERDILTLMKPVRETNRTQAEAGPPAEVEHPSGPPPAAPPGGRTRYPGFGPTLACEKLAEYEQLKVGRETLRPWRHSAALVSASMVAGTAG